MPKVQLVAVDTYVDAIGDASGRQKMVLGEGNVGGWFTDKTTVPTPGTAVQLTSHAIREGCSLMIKAIDGNAQNVYPGESAAQAQAHNMTLAAGRAISLQVSNSNKVYLDADAAGEGVEYWAEID